MVDSCINEKGSIFDHLKKKILCLLLLFFFLLGNFINATDAMTTEEEKKLGEKVFHEIEKKVEFVTDPTIQNFLDRIGQSLVDSVGPVPFNFKFYLIKSSEPNAFALPGGYIFITTGLINMAEYEQEIAGVLAHEIAHVTGRHIAQLIEKGKKINIASIVAILAAMLAGRGGVGSQAAATMASATAEALTLKYTREMEMDADQNGLNYLMKAGYDPNGIVSIFKKLFKYSLISTTNTPPYLSTHPAIENRVSLLENLLQVEPRSREPFRTIGNFKRVRTKVFIEEREPQAAITQFQSVINSNPSDTDAYYGLGLAFQKMGRLDKSIEALEQAHFLTPRDLDISRELGITYFLSGKVDQAIDLLETVRSSPEYHGGTDLMVLYYLGRGYQVKEDFSQALRLFQRVQKGWPEFVDVLLHLGSVYGRTGQKGLSHFYYGKYFKKKGDLKVALLHFRTALEGLEKGTPEREETQKEIQGLSSPRR